MPKAHPTFPRCPIPPTFVIKYTRLKPCQVPLLGVHKTHLSLVPCSDAHPVPTPNPPLLGHINSIRDVLRALSFKSLHVLIPVPYQFTETRLVTRGTAQGLVADRGTRKLLSPQQNPDTQQVVTNRQRLGPSGRKNRYRSAKHRVPS